MKIHYASDIHLEFGHCAQHVPRGDVMVLAGDITLLGALDHDKRLKASTADLFDRVTKNFSRVFYLAGNHESYRSNISKSRALIRKHLPGVTDIGSATDVDLGGNVILVGGTLWTDMNNGQAHQYIGGTCPGRARMNDFNLIRIKEKGGADRLFTTYDAVGLFKKTLSKIKRTAERNPGKTIVVATHHAPSRKGLNLRHSGGYLDAGYYTDLEAFIRSHPNILHWIHGHTHVQRTYSVGQCRVYSNARGYVGRDLSAADFSFDKSFVVEAHPRLLDECAAC